MSTDCLALSQLPGAEAQGGSPLILSPWCPTSSVCPSRSLPPNPPCLLPSARPLQPRALLHCHLLQFGCQGTPRGSNGEESEVSYLLPVGFLGDCGVPGVTVGAAWGDCGGSLGERWGSLGECGGSLGDCGGSLGECGGSLG